MWFLDTNACIMFSRGQAMVCARWHQHRANQLAIPMTVFGELMVGAEKAPGGICFSVRSKPCSKDMS